LARADDL